MIRAGKGRIGQPNEDNTMAPQKSTPKKEAGSGGNKQPTPADRKQDKPDPQRDERKGGRDSNR